MLRVQIADDHAMLRAGLRATLGVAWPDIELAPDISSGEDFLARVQQGQADILICDVNMPEFQLIPMLTALRARDAKPRVLVFSAEANRTLVQAAAAAGAAGYVLKKELETGTALAEILHTVAAGRTWFSPEVQPYFAPLMKQDTATAREQEVLLLMRAGKDPREIAVTLNLAVGRVYNLQSQLRQKFNAPTNTALVLKAQSL